MEAIQSYKIFLFSLPFSLSKDWVTQLCEFCQLLVQLKLSQILTDAVKRII